MMSSKAKPSSVNSLTVLKLSQSEFSEEPLDLADPPPNWLQDGSVGALSVYNSQDSKHPSRYTPVVHVCVCVCVCVHVCVCVYVCSSPVIHSWNYVCIFVYVSPDSYPLKVCKGTHGSRMHTIKAYK